MAKIWLTITASWSDLKQFRQPEWPEKGKHAMTNELHRNLSWKEILANARNSEQKESELRWPGAHPLLSSHSEDAVRNVFSTLTSAVLAQNIRKLEDITTNMVRSNVKEWLDRNLPSLVERLVREEIKRVSRVH
jgi:cell pole-organizing protein PopZ